MDVLEILRQNENKDLLRFVTAGSVDDGKSTLIGRLLYESKGIYEDQIADIRNVTSHGMASSEGVDLALVTDGLRAEREQGITIDVAYRYFSTPMRKFIIADTPGHEQYTRNMATGASTASLIIILIDAVHGVLTQSKRHAFIASLLGIPHVVVAVNKMDLVAYSRKRFEEICREFRDFAARLDMTDITFIPVSALKGDNVVAETEAMPWYTGGTLLRHLENVHIASDRNLVDLRFPVQYVLRPDSSFRGYLGTVASGAVRPGDEIMAIPSGVRGRVKSVFGPDGELDEAFAPMACGITLSEEIDVSRGDSLVHVHNVPRVSRELDAMVVWMSDEPMRLRQRYLVKHQTTLAPAEVTRLLYRVDVNTLHRSEAEGLALNEIGRCTVTLARPVAHDPYRRNRATGSFIVIDPVTNTTVGAGMILDREPNRYVPTEGAEVAEPRSTHVRRTPAAVAAAEREQRLGHRPAAVWLTGLTGSGKSTVAAALEQRLFAMGCLPAVLEGGNLRLGLNRDLSFGADDRLENVRRAAESAKILNQAGLVAICALLSPHEPSRQLAREIVGEEFFIQVYLDAPIELCRQRAPEIYAKADAGLIEYFPGVTSAYETPDHPDLTLATGELDVETCVNRIVALLTARGIIEPTSPTAGG